MIVSSPKIRGAAQRLFYPIIEVVSEGTDLRLHFYNRDEVVTDLGD